MAYLSAQVFTSYTILADGAVDFDINTVFTKILAHSSIIILYQHFVNVRNLNPGSPPHVAVQRCMQACEEIVTVIRNLANRALIHTLMHGLNMCARRWPMATRLDIVLRAAIVEIDTKIPIFTTRRVLEPQEDQS
jgi:hypothetical protein